jgi:hypothetical protein
VLSRRLVFVSARSLHVKKAHVRLRSFALLRLQGVTCVDVLNSYADVPVLVISDCLHVSGSAFMGPMQGVCVA